MGEVARQTAKLWRKHHLTYDQTKHVVEQTRRQLGVEAPRERRRTVERLDRVEVERLIESAYRHSSQYGFIVKMLFYTGACVSEFTQLRVEDLHLALDPPQVYISKAKGGSDGYVPILRLWRRNSARTLVAGATAMCSRATARTNTPRGTFRG